MKKTTFEELNILSQTSEFNSKPIDQCIHQLLEQQVSKSPHQVAVVCENQQLTYAELNIRANQLAHHLQALGVGPEVLVGIYLERSLEVVIAILGIFKAGGAYVPLDPAYPKERLAFMLEQTQVSVVLTQSHLVAGLPQQEIQTVCLDTDWELISRHNEATPVSQVTPQNLAYVMYTSGSTGKPKGVQITHANVWHYLQSISQILQLNAEDVYFHTASFSFSSSVRQLLLPLSEGAKVLIATNEQIKNPLTLFELIQQKGATVLDTVASVWRYGLSSIENLEPAQRDLLLDTKLRLCVFSGGLLPCQLLKKVRSQLKNPPRIVNIYGQTETIGVTAYPIPETFDQEQGYVPVGYALAHIHQLSILNEDLQPVAVGEAGELHVAGDSLTRGYLNRADLTAEKLISPENQTATPLLKTGDIASYLPDGSIEVLGRVDFQVKLRGMRVELGEIESVLEKHPKIKETVITAIDDQQGDKRLVAYIVFKATENIAQTEITRELRTFLEGKVTDYMVPSIFVVLEALPLTPNGKLDRLSLPAPDPYRPELDSNFVAPRTAGEESLAAIWAQVLGLERVGIHDNFFELGGHSLLATQVISRVLQTYSVDIPLRYLFESPTVASLAQLIETTPLTELGQQIPGISRLTERVNLPLSFSQQRMWFIDQLEPNSSAYNISIAYSINGQLNVAALEQSLAEIVQRHEALRTTFTTVNGQPVQLIHQNQTLSLPLVDLQDLPATEAERLTTEFAEQPFELATGPLWRVKLLRLGLEEHLLLVTIHHIVFDEWSLNVFFQELAALYKTSVEAETNTLSELPIQYADFAHWQQQWLQGSELKAQVDYWKQQLAGIPPVLELPTDRPRPSVMTFAGKKQEFVLPKTLTNALKALSQREGATLFMTLLAAFQTLLYRYSGQSDIVIGSPIAGRNRAETERLIGFFVNTLVLRTELSDNQSFRSLLGRVREMALQAYEHQNLPFEKLVEELRPERSLSYNPLFQVMFVLQNAPMLPIELPGLVFSPQPVERGTSQFDLTLELEETAGELGGFLEYNTDLFDDATISRMIGHFQTLLESIVANGERAISELPLLGADERQQLLSDWNGFGVEFPVDKCMHELFEAQVERNPDAVAVVFAQEQLTYGELNAKANQLAHYLRSLGVGPDQLVGICLERSLEMAVGFLGIFKSGGAYLPLDPKYPSDRLTFMLEDSQAKVLLTQTRLLESLPEHNAQVICLDTDWENVAQQSQANPSPLTTAENLAYVIYTSGSTGKPKGVMIPHQGLVNHNLAIAQQFNLAASDRILQFASISFDIAVEELFPSWIKGAAVVLRPESLLSAGKDFWQFVTQEQITILNLPTAFWHELVKEMSLVAQNLPTTMRLVVVGGEKASRSAYLTWAEQVGQNCRWLNTYGPTETTVTATVYDPAAAPQTHQNFSEIPIGRPIANAQVYILDQLLQPVPIGVPGELHIGGAGLARGYLNRPELTSEKFIANPYSDDPKARLYKTGDAVRYLADGNIDFVGRVDDQVKIRGFRIELGEIDTLLEQHPAVQQTIVIAREDVPGDKRLVAYVVPSQKELTTSELRSFVQERLPNYMVPSAFVFLEALPMTANGKVNRRALPAPDLSRQDTAETFVAPRNDLELQLSKLWEKVLGIPAIGVKDNFFELGGHSLLAVRLFSEIEKAFSKNLPLATLFQAPTIEELAIALSQNTGSASQLSMQAVQPKGSKPPIFFFYGLGGIPLELRNLAGYLGLDQPVYGWEPNVKQALSHTRVEDMAVQCVQELRTIQPQGPYFVGGYCTGDTIALEVAQQLQAQGQQVATLALFEHGFSNVNMAHFKNEKFPKLEALVDSLWDKAYLFNDFLKDDPKKQFKRIQLKLDTVKEKLIGNKLKVSSDQTSAATKETVENLDQILSAIPEELHELHRNFFNSQLQAMRSYAPKLYAGRVTFFLSRRWSFSRSYNNIKKIWTKAAAGGVDIILLPTSHQMFKEPELQIVAEKLIDYLNKSQSSN